MPINKFTTLLDLSRQAKIITGETATFDGKIEAGIPFSGYPTGVDTGTTVSLGIIASEEAIFSGDTGTTVFDVSNISSPNYSSVFSAYTATTWTDPTFSAYTSGLTLPITSVSANTQVLGPFWYLTQTGYTGDYIIGIEYTGFSVTYSFNNVAQFGTGNTYSGITTGIIENFSAGTLDYKGPLDYLQSAEDATIDGRLYTNKITISNGASASTIGYVLTQTGNNGEAEWLPNSSADTNTYVTGGTLSGTDLLLEWNNGGFANPIDLSPLSGGTFTGNTSGDCIGDIFVSKLHSCSPLEINPLDEGDIVIGSNNNLYFDITNSRLGIGKAPSLGILDITHPDGNFILRPSGTVSTISVSGKTTQFTQVFATTNGSLTNSGLFLTQIGESCTLIPNYGNPNDSLIYSNGANSLNIITLSGSTGDKNIKIYAGSNLPNTSDVFIQGSGLNRGYIGFGTENPQSKVDVRGNTFLSGSGTNTLTVVGSGSSTTEPIVSISGSSGELFTIKDSLVDSLFSVNDISGIPTLEVFDDNTVLMGSYSAPAMYTTFKFQPITGLTNLYSIDMGEYTGAWFDYTVVNSATFGARSGQIMAIFSGNTVNYVETTTSSIGSTSAITLSLSANTVDCILQSSATTFGWSVKTIIRSI